MFHFTARRGWINDPHGITLRDGNYHVFFQFVPESINWRVDCRWGHAVGPDLFSLTEHPVAIAPGDGDDGIWTGSLWPARDGDPFGAKIWFTSVRQPAIGIGSVREARPDDAAWDAWTKGEIVLSEPPPELGVTAFRDPFIFADEHRTMALLGAALPDGRAAALRYEITSTGEWQYRGILASRSASETDPAWMGTLWECPQLVPIGDGRHALITSVWNDDVLHYAGAGVGVYAGGTFNASTWQQLTWGDSHYAPSAFRDEDGRWCLLFWMRQVGSAEAGWAGAHSVPYLILSDQEGVRLAVHPSLERYRDQVDPDHVRSSHADMVWEPAGPGSQLVAVAGPSRVEITAGRDETSLTVDGGASSTIPGRGPIRLLIDGAVVEVVVEGRVLGKGIEGGDVSVTADGVLQAWALRR